ncbi:MAG: histidine phosphatase family protein [Candidatus Gastranaerophilaceae bacterium]|jgi:broad specificity phosphatase PhoE
MFEKKCKIIFIRHGSTIYTEQNRLYDADDYPPINEKGKAEIVKLAEWMKIKSLNVDLIYSSNAIRSIQSARILSKHLKKDFEIIDGLYERKPGIWSGLTFNQIEKKFPDMLCEYHKNPCTFCPEGGESTIEVKKRVGTIIDKIVKDNLYKKVIIVTHSGVIQSAISHALDISPIHQTKIHIPTGAATQINYYGEWASLVYSGYVPL